jgi:hypothetical protein
MTMRIMLLSRFPIPDSRFPTYSTGATMYCSSLPSGMA